MGTVKLPPKTDFNVIFDENKLTLVKRSSERRGEEKAQTTTNKSPNKNMTPLKGRYRDFESDFLSSMEN